MLLVLLPLVPLVPLALQPQPPLPTAKDPRDISSELFVALLTRSKAHVLGLLLQLLHTVRELLDRLCQVDI